MTEPHRPPPARSSAPKVCGAVALASLLCTVAARVGGETADPPAAAKAAPDPFAGWPADAKPDAVLILTGQTYGYLQPCGCSRPQLGGLERRANLVAGLKAKGWAVGGFDLGDVLPYAGVVPEQVLLKYTTAMNALREMGYLAVGVGRSEFNNGLFRLTSEYAGQKEQPPYTLGGNVGGLTGGRVTPRAETFVGSDGRPTVGLAQVDEIGGVPVGVAAVVGPSVAAAVAKQPNTRVGFTPEADALAAAVKVFADHPKKPKLNVLLYQGSLDEARTVAKDRPEFTIVMCQSTDPDPPQTPVTVTHASGAKTLIVQTGFKGQHVGVVGVFKKPDGGFDLKYRLVTLGEEYATPPDPAAEKANTSLGLLEEYAARVKARNFIARFPQGPPPGQTKDVGLSYVGSAACEKCHTAEHATWKGTAHSHAMDALEKATRPALRNFDGECVVCHTTGFGYKSGYRDDLSTPTLKHVGCESCHGPGSGHAADPKNPRLLAQQSPWKRAATDRLPALATMERLAQLPEKGQDKAVLALPAAQQRAVTAVSQACAACHDPENDPLFNLFRYWPKVYHAAKK